MRKYAVISVITKYVFWWRKIKVVAGYDNIATHELQDTVGNIIKRNVWKKFIKLFFPLTDVLVVPSDTAKKDLIKNFNILEKKVVVNKNWVFVPQLRRVKRKSSQLVYVGRLDPQKNIGLMVEVVDKVKKVIPSVKLNIIGNGKQIREIKKDVTKRKLDKQIKFLGSQKDVGKYLKVASVFLLTSNYEGLPIAALEAMAYRLPIITTSYPGAAELVLHNKSGYICKNKDNYVRKVVELLKNSNKRTKMGLQAQYYVKTNHSISNLTKFIGLLGF